MNRDLAKSKFISFKEVDLNSQPEKIFKDHYWPHREDIRHYIGKVLVSPEDSEEILQETYARALGKISESILNNDTSKIRSYLFIIAANLTKDILRKKRFRNTDNHLTVENISLESNEPGPECAAVSNQFKGELLLILKRLQPRARKIFVMHKFMKLSQAVIAQRLEISTRTVERDLSATIELMRKQLREHL